jgi:hypothetical protein
MDRFQTRARHNHRLGAATDLVASEGLEVLNHHFRFLGDVVRMQL